MVFRVIAAFRWYRKFRKFLREQFLTCERLRVDFEKCTAGGSNAGNSVQGRGKRNTESAAVADGGAGEDFEDLAGVRLVVSGEEEFKFSVKYYAAVGVENVM